MEFQVTPSFFKQLYQFDTVYYPQLVDDFRLWILVHYPNEPTMPETAWAFLQKILNAAQLRPQEYRISNTASKDWKNYSLTSPLPYRQVWILGDAGKIAFPDLPTDALYEPQEAGEMLVLRSDTLEKLQNDTELKKRLWAALLQLMQK